MPRLYLSIHLAELDPGHGVDLPTGPSVALAHAGSLTLNGAALDPAGFAMDGRLQGRGVAIAFTLTPGPCGARSEAVEVEFPCLIRLDEVAFPPGAVAYRHVHAGPGFRHLRWGVLHLDAGDHQFDAEAGVTWFEAAHSPVQATASPDHQETRFVRCMILPLDYQGRPTIRFLDPQDAERPRLQVTHRHVDQLLLGHGEAG
ncbi:MAG: hypothetical protein AAFQ66_20090 [Pseudomonadota bacterium]